MTRRVLLALCSAPLLRASESIRAEDTLDAMGALYRIAAFGEDADHTARVLQLAFEEIQRLDRLLSNYRRESDWSQINRDAAQRPVRVTPELFRLLEACQAYSRASDGAFDITVGPLMKLWGFYRRDNRVPSPQEIQDALKLVGWRKVELDPQNRTVRFTQPGVEIDPGGIGKGYAVDRAAAILRENGIASAMISAAGSSMYAIGAPSEEARGWHVNIRHPQDPEVTVAEIFLKDQSMSTSGSYERFFTANGKTYSHIMDPRTGYPAQGVLSVSVVAPLCLDSEAWTKPFFVRGHRWTEKNKSADFRVFLCEDGSNLKCAWLP